MATSNYIRTQKNGTYFAHRDVICQCQGRNDNGSDNLFVTAS